jgi:hypothetical protein
MNNFFEGFLKILPVTRLKKNPKTAIMTLKIKKCLQEAACDSAK